MALSVETLAKRIISAADYTVTKVHKILEPDVDDESEVLFRGRYKGDSRACIRGDEEDGVYRCIVRGDGTGYVVEGW